MEKMKNNKKVTKQKNKNDFIMKLLTFLGVLILGFIIVYLMYYFFVKKSDIYINMSTDKRVDYVNVNNEKKVIITQKYVSDLGYNMRYDMNMFRVFKYNKEDYYRLIDDTGVMLIIEKSSKPSNCINANSVTNYENCYTKLDEYTEVYYITNENQTYKITIKNTDYLNDEKTVNELKFMLDSLVIESNV